MEQTQASERAQPREQQSDRPSNAGQHGASIEATAPGGYKVIRRNGKVTPFDARKIELAVTKAFIDVEGQQGAASSRIRETVKNITEQVVQGVTRSLPGGGAVHIEDIQDYVELALMRSGEHKVARSYVLYREERAHERAARQAASGATEAGPGEINVAFADGTTAALGRDRLARVIDEACAGIAGVTADTVLKDTLKNAFDGISEDELSTALILSARQRLEAEPNYGQVAARLLMDKLRHEALTFLADGQVEYATHAEMRERYPAYFKDFIAAGVAHELLDPRLADYDLERLGEALIADRDLAFTYLGLQTLYDRYFIHHESRRFELPQAFYMRVAMGLAINEIEREERAIEFYKLLSSFDFMSSTPTLFNSGTLRPQLSSCYLTSVADDLHGIYEAVQDNALLSKFAGGLGNDWTPVRAMGAHIKGTNGKSQGVVPFLKVVNDTAVAVNQGGKRKGAVCAYLETWHKDIEEFLDLRKNTGDDRRRCHDMNTANWVPDLFVKRVLNDEPWTLFSPNDVPDLHDLTGKAFEAAYVGYEAKAERGEIKNTKTLSAVNLWRKMLSLLFETGHPWFTFKDPCNLRSPQQHKGVVHSSNLCCIAADQRVVTDRGMLTVGELYRLGGQNKVVGLDRHEHASEMLLPRPNAPMVEIQTDEGYTHKVTPDHKVWLKDYGWREAQELCLGDKLLMQQIEGLWGLTHKPDLAYLMGLIAGDGTFGRYNTHIDLWENDFALRESIEDKTHAVLECGNETLNTSSVNEPIFHEDSAHDKARLTSAPLKRVLESYGFCKESKLQVPELVWQGSRETVAAYLRGLYQADGHVQTSKDITTLVLASSDLDLIRDLQILWANFGVKASINQMRGRSQQLLPDGHGGNKHYWVKPLYRLLITSVRGCRIAESVTGLAKFRANRSEAARQFLENISCKEGYSQKLYATFKCLTHLPNEDAFCLRVDSATHAWTVNGLITKNTEITLNTSPGKEIAVCNLGSINLPQHIEAGKLDTDKLERTVNTALRMLDNVIEYNYYSVKTARDSNLRHRPVGLGLMGFQDALYKLKLPYESDEAVDFADRSMEQISYFAIKASTNLAEERGAYSSFKGSLWDQGVLPIDSIQILRENRGAAPDGEQYLDQDEGQTLDWETLRNRVMNVGMRNSNCMAIAPTATIANITGVSQSIEPTYQNLYVKSNLSGEFTVANPYLVEDLKALDLWDEVMANDLKYYDGSVQAIDRIPDVLKVLYKCAFEIDPRWLVEAGSRRQKWLDQAQSLNLYMAEPSGRKLDELYKFAWKKGLKTTYYLRSTSATHTEKSTITDHRLNAVGNGGQGSGNGASAGGSVTGSNGSGRPTSSASTHAANGAGNGQSVSPAPKAQPTAPMACAIDDPDCEACQ